MSASLYYNTFIFFTILSVVFKACETLQKWWEMLRGICCWSYERHEIVITKFFSKLLFTG